MSVNDLVDAVEEFARRALFDARAVRGCSFHDDAVIRLGDHEAERRAYAFATNALKAEGCTFLREDVMEAIKHELDMADDECVQCDNMLVE